MMNRSVMGRQMFAKGGAAFPDLSGDGKVTQKDILMGRGVVPMADGGEVPGDVRAIFQGLVESMRGSKEDVAAYVRGNTQDLSDIAKMYPNMAAMINEGFKVTSEVPMQEYFPPEYGQSPESFAPMQPNMDTSREEFDDALDRMRQMEEREQGNQMLIPQPPPGVMEEMPEAPPFTRLQMGGEPMAAAMEQGAMPAEPMAAMAAPSPADLGSMDTAGIASQMDPEVVAIMQGAANNFGDPEQAESLEGMMDAVRGTRATEEERREELAGVVGPEDAAATPDSVLAMVQPLMLLMGAQGAMETEVDTGGIGPMAQDTMNVPVSGDMAGGIMQMAAAPPPPPEGGVPPVNFSQGGEVLRFSEGKVVPDYSQVVAGDMPVVTSPTLKAAVAAPKMTDFAAAYKPQRTLEEAYQQRLPLLQQITDGGGKDAAQIQFFSDLAKAGAAFAQPGKPGQSVLSQLAASVAGSGIAENAAKLAASREATERALKLRAFEGAEKELEAEEAARRTSELTRNTMFNQGVMALTGRQQKIVDMENAFDQNVALTEQKAAIDQLQAEYNAGIGFMSQAKLLQMKDQLDTARTKLNQAFEKNTIELKHQKAVDLLGLTQTYDLEKLDQSLGSQARLQQERIDSAEKIASNKLQQDKLIAEAKNADAKRRREIEERLAKVKEEELSIKRHAADLKKISDKAKQYEKPGAFVPALLNEKVPYTRVVPAVSDMDAPSKETGEEVYYKLWASGQVPKNDPTALQLSTMLEGASGGSVVYGGPDQGYVLKPETRFSPEINRAIVKRYTLPNSDVSPRVATRAELQLISGDKDALKKKMNTMQTNVVSMFDGMGKTYREDPQTTVSKAASDLKAAMGLSGLTSRALSTAKRFVDIDTVSAADRGSFIGRRIYVDGLQAALSALPGKENVKIQELLSSVMTGNMLAVSSPAAFYNKSAVYLGSLRSSINRLEEASKVPTITAKDLQSNLTALNELYATEKGVQDLMDALDEQNNITGR